jgi:hypothetical protein
LLQPACFSYVLQHATLQAQGILMSNKILKSHMKLPMWKSYVIKMPLSKLSKMAGLLSEKLSNLPRAAVVALTVTPQTATTEQ